MLTLIFGARGQLGRDLMTLFAQGGEVAGYDLPEVDAADAAVVGGLVAQHRPTLVVNAAAYTDVEGAEEHRETAFRANETGARVVAAAAREAGVPVVYYSTDFVFCGDATRRTPFEPEEPIHPKGVYAESKAAGEAATRAANPRHFILRTAWLYGPGGNNFVEKILRAAAVRPALTVVDDEIGSPTHTLDLTQATQALAQTTAFGTYHAVNAGMCNRFEFAKEILRLGGLDTPVSPCKAADYPSKAPRPAYSVLSCRSLEAACGYRMRPWTEALAHYFERREIPA